MAPIANDCKSLESRDSAESYEIFVVFPKFLLNVTELSRVQ